MRLLTGLNHHAVGMGTLANYDLGFDGYRGAISSNAAMLPEISREQGWEQLCRRQVASHADASHRSFGPFYQWPTQRGFRPVLWTAP